MIKNKYINKISVILTAVALAAAFAVIIAAKSGTVTAANAPYVTKLFGSEIIKIEILADKDVWQGMLGNAAAKEYIMADVIVNGVKFQKVGIRPKGNVSLSNSDRYSFRLKFNHYIKKQTCFGLASFVVNNMKSDNTYIKEYIAYDLMRSAGADTTLCQFADISLNGEPWGFYLAVESYAGEFIRRAYNDALGVLYNVKSTGLGDIRRTGDLGGSLIYTDDDPDSYPAIFLNAVTKTNTAAKKRVIKALKALSEGRDLETYFDIDQILRYFAAHTVTVNMDSYSSFTAQNYYIYESKGKLTILPWDYNLAFGGFQGNGNLSDMVNFPIDSPVSGVEMSERPLLDKLLGNEEYLERYHKYLRELIDDYFNSGKFSETVAYLTDRINDYVKNDVSKFCTYEEYKTAAAEFEKLLLLRARSIEGQLNGTIPSTAEGQARNRSALISAASIYAAALKGSNGGFMKRDGNISDNGEVNDFNINGCLVWGTNPYMLLALAAVFAVSFVFVVKIKVRRY